MVERIDPDRNLLPLQSETGKKQEPRTERSRESFARHLEESLKRLEDVKLSAHAERRIRDRSIDLAGQAERINTAIEKARAKGARESLVVVDTSAYIVSVKNRTIITAMDGESIRENVFTNIDSAVIM